MNIKNVIKTGLAIYGGTALAVKLAVNVILVPIARRIMVKHDAVGVYTLNYVDYANTKRPRRTKTIRYIVRKGGKTSNE